MSTAHMNRRQWMAWLSLSSTASLGTANATTHAMWSESTLATLAEKVLKELHHDFVNDCAQRIAAQIAQCTTSTPMETIAQWLHADDVAFGRVTAIQGIDFSHTQIGLLALAVRNEANQ